MRHMGSGPSVALLRSLDCSGQADYVADEFSLGNGATWACAWNDVSAKFGVGMEKHAVLMDVQTRRLWELNTQGSDVVSQVFSRGVSGAPQPAPLLRVTPPSACTVNRKGTWELY